MFRLHFFFFDSDDAVTLPQDLAFFTQGSMPSSQVLGPFLAGKSGSTAVSLTPGIVFQTCVCCSMVQIWLYSSFLSFSFLLFLCLLLAFLGVIKASDSPEIWHLGLRSLESIGIPFIIMGNCQSNHCSTHSSLWGVCLDIIYTDFIQSFQNDNISLRKKKKTHRISIASLRNLGSLWIGSFWARILNPMTPRLHLNTGLVLLFGTKKQQYLFHKTFQRPLLCFLQRPVPFLSVF